MTTMHRFADPVKLAEGLSGFIVQRAIQAAAADRPFSLALSGGSTPKATYRRLAERVPESGLEPGSIELFWGDERCVPLEDERSNYRMAREAWLSGSSISEANIHPILCQDDPDRAAAAYEELIRLRRPGESVPRLDLILLGLGEDGHTASLFPGDEAIEGRDSLVVAVRESPDGLPRVSFTPALINAAHAVAFLVAGESKAGIVQRVIKGPHDPSELPAQAVDPDPGELHWFLDRAAAREL